MRINLWELKRLREIRDCATMKSACFDSNSERDKEIKIAIRLWVSTWIENPLTTIIDAIENRG